MNAAPERPASVPPLVLLHGLFGDADNLRSLGRRLEAAPGGAREVLRPHLPGHGGRASTATLDHASLARAIAADIAEAFPGRAVHLLGHSLGGKVAMTLAGLVDAPPLVSITVLDIAPRAYPPHHADILSALGALDPARLASRREADAALAAGVPNAGTRAFLLKSLAPLPDGGHSLRFDLDAIERDYAHIAARVPDGDANPAPALFLYGENSDYVDPAIDADEILARFPNARLEGVPDAGHWLHAERTDAVATACAAHLEAAEARAAIVR